MTGPIVSVCAPLTMAFVESRAPGLRLYIEMIHQSLELAGCRLFSAHRVEDWGHNTHELTADEVARRDFGWIRRCHVVACILSIPGQSKAWRTDGTFVELGWATAMEKPIALIGELELYSSLLIRGLPALGAQVLDPRELMARPQTLVDFVRASWSASGDGAV